MLFSVLIAVTIACLITAITTFVSITMCLHLRRRRKASKAVDDESTLRDFPVTTRKLTIDRGNVVTAPSSPRIPSLARFSRPPKSSRNSSSTYVQEPMSKFTFSRNKVHPSTPSSPRSPVSSVSPTSTRPAPSIHAANDRPKTHVPMPEQAWLESISALSHPEGSVIDAEALFKEKRAARDAKIPRRSETEISRPSTAITSDQISINQQRKASLGALSQAVSEVTHSQSSSSSPRISADGFSPRPSGSRTDLRARSSSKSKQVLSPTINVDIPTPTVSAINTPRSSIHSFADARKSKSDRPRRSKPPPLTITTSRQPPKVPETFLQSPTDSIATVHPAVRDEKDNNSMHSSLRLNAGAPQSIRQSVLSFSSSQYSPTFSIKPVDQVQILQPVRAQQIPARTGQPTPPATATPKPIFPSNYSISQNSKYHTSIDSRVVPETPESMISAAPPASGLKDIPAAAARTGSEPTIYEAPLTSASISFPPNLPDYSFTPNGTPTTELPDLPMKPRQASAPQTEVPRNVASPKLRTPRSGTGLRRKEVESSRSATITVAELPARDDATSPYSLKSAGLKGTASVSMSEIAKKVELERARHRIENARQPSH